MKVRPKAAWRIRESFHALPACLGHSCSANYECNQAKRDERHETDSNACASDRFENIGIWGTPKGCEKVAEEKVNSPNHWCCDQCPKIVLCSAKYLHGRSHINIGKYASVATVTRAVPPAKCQYSATFEISISYSWVIRSA